MSSDRLLRGMHKVCSHDLPNQLVVLQSLLQMLLVEEADRLSPDGQEYVRRLQNATRRTTAMVRFLKEMEKLTTYVGKPEELSLSVLAREIQAALKQQFPAKVFAFDWQWTVPQVVGDYRTMLHAILEILACGAEREGDRCVVRGTTTVRENQIALDFLLATTSAPGDNPSLTLERAIQPAMDQRMEIILAREWLAVSQARLEIPGPHADGCPFTILVPSR